MAERLIGRAVQGQPIPWNQFVRTEHGAMSGFLRRGRHLSPRSVQGSGPLNCAGVNGGRPRGRAETAGATLGTQECGGPHGRQTPRSGGRWPGEVRGGVAPERAERPFVSRELDTRSRGIRFLGPSGPVARREGFRAASAVPRRTRRLRGNACRGCPEFAARRARPPRRGSGRFGEHRRKPGEGGVDPFPEPGAAALAAP